MQIRIPGLGLAALAFSLLLTLCSCADKVETVAPGTLAEDGISNVYLQDGDFYYIRRDGALYKVLEDGFGEFVDRFSTGSVIWNGRWEESAPAETDPELLFENDRCRIRSPRKENILIIDDLASSEEHRIKPIPSEQSIEYACTAGDQLYFIQADEHLMQIPLGDLKNGQPVWQMDAGKTVWMQPAENGLFCLRVAKQKDINYLEPILISENDEITSFGISNVQYEIPGSISCLISGNSYIFGTVTCPNICVGSL